MDQTVIPGSCYQLGFVTRDYQALKKTLMHELNVSDFFLFENIEFINLKFRNQAVSAKVNVAIGYSGDLQIEIVEPLGGNDLYAECLENNQFGLHHVGILVDDLSSELKLRGLTEDRVLQFGYVGREKSIQFAFLDTKSTLGVLTELVWLSPSIQKTYARLKQRALRKLT